MAERIRLEVPASSANLGPGFDTLAAALNLRNIFTIECTDEAIQLNVDASVPPHIEELTNRMIQQAAEYFFTHAGIPWEGFFIRMENRVPIARGLASSATLRLAILEGLNHLHEANLSRDTIALWASELEGCTDNIAASYYGGFTASGIYGGRFRYYSFPIDEALDFVAVSPTDIIETDKARTIFPEQVPRSDAISNINRAVMLGLAFARQDYDWIRDLFDDALHQPQRQASIQSLRPLQDVIDAAKEAGAIGAYLSGSGSTMMAITRFDKEGVALAMQQVITRYNMQSDVHYLKADNEGLRWVIEA